MLRVDSVSKFLPHNNNGTTNIIEWAYSRQISATDLPEDDGLLNHGDYIMLLLEALSNKTNNERKHVGVTIRLLVFKKKKNTLAERV